jgi:hypothetical protein
MYLHNALQLLYKHRELLILNALRGFDVSFSSLICNI